MHAFRSCILAPVKNTLQRWLPAIAGLPVLVINVMARSVTWLLTCAENKQILQRAEEMHPQFWALLSTWSGPEEDYSTSHLSGLHWSSHYQWGPEKAEYLFVLCLVMSVLLCSFYVCPVLRCACHAVKYAMCKWQVLLLLTLLICWSIVSWILILHFILGFLYGPDKQKKLLVAALNMKTSRYCCTLCIYGI